MTGPSLAPSLVALVLSDLIDRIRASLPEAEATARGMSDTMTDKVTVWYDVETNTASVWVDDYEEHECSRKFEEYFRTLFMSFLSDDNLDESLQFSLRDAVIRTLVRETKGHDFSFEAC